MKPSNNKITMYEAWMSKNTTIRIAWTSSEGYEVDMRRSRDRTSSRDEEETKEEKSQDEKSQEQSQGMVPYNGTQDDANGSNWNGMQ